MKTFHKYKYGTLFVPRKEGLIFLKEIILHIVKKTKTLTIKINLLKKKKMQINILDSFEKKM